LRAQRAAIEGTLAPTPTTIPGAMPGAPTPAAPGMAPDMYGWEDPAMAPGAVPRPGVAPGTPGQPPIRNPLAPAVAPQEGPRPEQVAPVQGVVRLVAHDLTVERGKTYRYRLRARIGNPLFMQEGMQPVQRAELHNRLSRTTPWSDWSQPVTVDTGQRFFLVRATQRNNAVV